MDDSSRPGYPTLIFPPWIDERAKAEAPARGYLSGAVVRCHDEREFPVFFVDPVRLRQELDDNAAAGQPWFAEPNLIVLPEVSVSAMNAAVRALWDAGFFSETGARSARASGDS
jgi:hypothetical protein